MWKCLINMENSMNKNKGFTLLEVMIVVMVIGILSVIAIPSYNDYIERGELADAKQAAVSMHQAFEANRVARPRDFNTDAQFKAELSKEKSKISSRITRLYNFQETVVAKNGIPLGFTLQITPKKSGKKYTMTMNEKGLAERCLKASGKCESF